MGAHSLGRAEAINTGFSGPWSFQAATLDNDYYKTMADTRVKWVRRTVRENRDLPAVVQVPDASPEAKPYLTFFSLSFFPFFLVFFFLSAYLSVYPSMPPLVIYLLELPLILCPSAHCGPK